jgi:hypothetical protein
LGSVELAENCSGQSAAIVNLAGHSCHGPGELSGLRLFSVIPDVCPGKRQMGKELTMEIRCPNCGWTSEMSAEAISAAIAAAEQKQANHHIEHCPRCQWVIRVPLEELRVTAPPLPAFEVPVEAVPVEAVPVMAVAKKPRAARKPAAKRKAKPKAAPKKAAKKKAPAKKTVKKTPAKKARPKVKAAPKKTQTRKAKPKAKK